MLLWTLAIFIYSLNAFDIKKAYNAYSLFIQFWINKYIIKNFTHQSAFPFYKLIYSFAIFFPLVIFSWSNYNFLSHLLPLQFGPRLLIQLQNDSYYHDVWILFSPNPFSCFKNLQHSSNNLKSTSWISGKAETENADLLAKN